MSFGTLLDLDVYRKAERYGDRLHEWARGWDTYALQTTGTQMVRAADSIGANIAEGFGRYHYAERIRFLYIARGSAYETVHWLRRAKSRGYVDGETADKAIEAYFTLIHSLNGYIASIRNRQGTNTVERKRQSSVAESRAEYVAGSDDKDDAPF